MIQFRGLWAVTGREALVFNRNDSINVEGFWKEREEELGSPVLRKTLGRVVEEKKQRPLWGLFYTTANAVFFQTFRSENWMSLILTSGRGRSSTKDEIVEIPGKSITFFGLRERKTGFLKFLDKTFLVEISWHDESSRNANRTLLFEMDGDAEGFVNSLNC